MAIKYNLSAIEIVKLLGCSTPAGKVQIEVFEQKNKVKLPLLLSEFLSGVVGTPLFSTADIWTDRGLFFFYQMIDERIEEDKECWEEDPDEEDEYYQFSQIPKEEWPDHVDNYLESGSDFAAGVATFGIPANRLEDSDPPVYILHEANSLTEWELLYSNLSDWLMVVLCDVLSCVNFDTAQVAVEELGWHYQKLSGSQVTHQSLAEKGIELALANPYYSTYGTDAEAYCCCDEEQSTLYVVRKDENRLELCILSK